MFEHLVAQLRKPGSIQVDASLSVLNIAARSHFAGAKPVKDGLCVGFVLRGKRVHSRIARCEPIGGDRYSHRVLLKTRRDIDAGYD